MEHQAALRRGSLNRDFDVSDGNALVANGFDERDGVVDDRLEDTLALFARGRRRVADDATAPPGAFRELLRRRLQLNEIAVVGTDEIDKGACRTGFVFEPTPRTDGRLRHIDQVVTVVDHVGGLGVARMPDARRMGSDDITDLLPRDQADVENRRERPMVNAQFDGGDLHRRQVRNPVAVDQDELLETVHHQASADFSQNGGQRFRRQRHVGSIRLPGTSLENQYFELC